MTVIAIKRRRGFLNPDLSRLQAAAEAVVATWGTAADQRPKVRLYWLRKPRHSWRVVWSSKLPPGAAGVHLDSNGTPYALIGASEGIEVVAHEVLEMLVDPLGERFIEGPSLRSSRPVRYLVEVCDPVEATPYAWVDPSFYAEPELQPGGYVSWIEGGHWWQAFADDYGHREFRNLGPAIAMTRIEKDRLEARHA